MTKTEKLTGVQRLTMAAAVVAITSGLLTIFGVVFYAGGLSTRVDVNTAGIAAVKNELGADIKTIRADIKTILARGE